MGGLTSSTINDGENARQYEASRNWAVRLGPLRSPATRAISTEYTLHAIRNPDTAKVLAEHDKQLRDELTELLRLLLKKSGHKTDVDLDMLARLVVAIHPRASRSQSSGKRSRSHQHLGAADQLVTASARPTVLPMSSA